MIKEFKEFITHGSVLDAAVGFVMGLAFKAIVDSFVNDILMPIIGILTAGIDFSSLKIVLREAQGETEEVAITYGQLIQSIISFLLIALFLFLVIRTVNSARRKHEEVSGKEDQEDAEKTETELDLLKDIRSLLEKEETENPKM